MSSAGKISIELDGPYPVWARLVIGDKHVATLRHDDLADLEYAAGRAMKEARLRLRENADEV